MAVKTTKVGDKFAGEDMALALRKRPRIGEELIRIFLFLCGVLSIITTIGIVLILGIESLNFFTNPVPEDINKDIAAAISETDTTIYVGESGNTVLEGDTLEVDDELMAVLDVDEEGTMLVVERGVDGTEIEAHRSGRPIGRATDASLWGVLTGSEWKPQTGLFGIWPLVGATLMTSLIAMIVALPLGLATAIYLSEYAGNRARNILKPILEILAGIPTVVYGYFALTFVTPLLRNVIGDDIVGIFNMASAGIVVGILIIPLVSSMSEDALSAVPNSLRQASYGLGATKLETALRVVVPGALSGITAAFVVAISRAIGETMIVAIASGASTANFTWPWQEGGSALSKTPFNPFIAAETMTGHIVRISKGDLSRQSIDYQSLFVIGLTLFLITLLLNIISRRIVDRFREVYD